MEIQIEPGNHITILPDNILLKIFSYLPYNDIFNFNQCSKNVSGIFSRIKLIKQYVQNGYITKSTRKLFYCSNLNYHNIHKHLLKEFPQIKAQTPNEFYTQLLKLVNNEISSNKNFQLTHKQIETNISKTFFQNDKFLKGNGKDELREILTCIMFTRPESGYNQNMNDIVCTLIEMFHNEEKINESQHKVFCFYTMLILIDEYELNTLYMKNISTIQMRIYQQNALFEEFFPLFYAHITRNKIELGTFFSEWILTLFSSYLPLPILEKTFDCFIIQKWKSFYKFSMVFINFIYDKIGTMDLEAMSKYIKEHKTFINKDYSKISQCLPEYKITSKHLQELSDDFIISQVRKKLNVIIYNLFNMRL